jgi:hypothetical protein
MALVLHSIHYYYNSTDLSRWDALIAGQYTPVTLAEKRGRGTQFDNKHYARFRTRPGYMSQTQYARDRIQTEFGENAKNLIISFRSSRADFETGLPESDQSHILGETRRPHRFESSFTRITLAFELMEPLMSMNLTPTELAIEIFKVTVILLRTQGVQFPSLLNVLSKLERSGSSVSPTIAQVLNIPIPFTQKVS